MKTATTKILCQPPLRRDGIIIMCALRRPAGGSCCCSADTRKHNFQQNGVRGRARGSLWWPRCRVYIGWPTLALTRRAHHAHAAAVAVEDECIRIARAGTPAGQYCRCYGLACDGGGGGTYGENIVWRVRCRKPRYRRGRWPHDNYCIHAGALPLCDVMTGESFFFLFRLLRNIFSVPTLYTVAMPPGDPFATAANAMPRQPRLRQRTSVNEYRHRTRATLYTFRPNTFTYILLSV